MLWLADNIIENFLAIPGSRDREQILELIKNAKRIWLSDDIVAATIDTIYQAPHSIEKNLDRIPIFEHPLWIEYKEPGLVLSARNKLLPNKPKDQTDIIKIGCLLSTDPDNPDHILVFVTWILTSGEIGHSFSFLHWSQADLFSLAASVRHHDDGNAAARIVETSVLSLSSGFKEEMAMLKEWGKCSDCDLDRAAIQTMKDAGGQYLFLLSALLMIDSAIVDVIENSVGRMVFFRNRHQNSWDRIWHSQTGGFYNIPFNRKIGWSQPISVPNGD